MGEGAKMTTSSTLQAGIWESTKRQAAIRGLCIIRQPLVPPIRSRCDWLSDDGVCVSSTGCMYSQSQVQEKT